MAPIALMGCANSAQRPYIGRWTGEFDVKQVTGKLPISEPRRNKMKGFVQLYLTDSRIAFHMEGEQEAVDAKGHWEIRRHQIRLTFSDVKVDDAGGLDGRDPNKAYIPPTAIARALTSPLALNISPDNKGLSSGFVLIGPLLGSYSFTKDAFGK